MSGARNMEVLWALQVDPSDEAAVVQYKVELQKKLTDRGARAT